MKSAVGPEVSVTFHDLFLTSLSFPFSDTTSSPTDEFLEKRKPLGEGEKPIALVTPRKMDLPPRWLLLRKF
jgi:hypothetical protein